MAVNILVGAETFAELRRKKYWYADKTGFLEKFLSPVSAKVTLFTRPRRFGKTLTLSMMSEFFDITKQSGDIFSGLRISENKPLCDTWMNQYPVVFMSLKDVDGENFDEALACFKTSVKNTCAQYAQIRESAKVLKEDRDTLIAFRDKTADVAELKDGLATLTRALEAYYGRPAILLIDEYDVPIANAWKKGYYEKMIDFMRGFLGAALKGNTSLEFGVLTGCLRITKESLFTGLNSLACYGVGDERYAAMFGFTGEEVDALLAEAGLADRKDIVREWYDGYCFGTNQNIYCPWSILRYVDYVQEFPTAAPEAWWVNTSANELTGGFAGKLSSGSVPGDRNGPDGRSAMGPGSLFERVRNDMVRLWEGGSIAVRLNETPSYATLYDSVNNFWTLLYMTGYLTRARGRANGVAASRSGATLTIPNKEVREVFLDEIGRWFQEAHPRENWTPFFDAFWRADAQQCARQLSDFLLESASHHDTQDRGWPETVYHGLLLGIFAPSIFCIRSNREAGEGRYDLAVTDPDNSRAAILEIKRAGTVKELTRAARDGLEQIAMKQYDHELRMEGYRTILHWSMAFRGKRCLARARLIDNC